MDLLLLPPERGMGLQAVTFWKMEISASPVVLCGHFLVRGSGTGLSSDANTDLSFPFPPPLQEQA